MNFLVKQRLIGAIVLVALGVIFIPMLLDSPKDNLVPQLAPLPEPGDRFPGQALEQLPAPLDLAEEPEQSVLQIDPAEPRAAMPPLEAGTPPKPELKPDPVPEPELKPEPEVDAGSRVPKPSTPPIDTATGEQEAGTVVAADRQAAEPGPLGNWVVQMGSFSDEKNALRLRDRLREADFDTQIEKVKISDKTHFRVRVGPYLERADAERDLKKLTQGFDLKGRILAYP